MTSWTGYGLFHLAAEKGFFEKNGVEVDITVVEDESTTPAALESNQFQGQLTTVDTHVRTIAAGVDLVQTLVVDDSNGGDGIVATSDIQSVQDMAGKEVGVKVASTSYVFLLSILKQNGMSVEDIKVVDLLPSDAGAAFVSGQLDVAVTWEPFLSKATKREGGHVLVSSREVPGLIVDSLGVRRDWLAANPVAMEGLIKGYYEAYEWWQQNPDEAIQIMAESQEVSPQEFEETIPGVTFFSPDQIAEFMNASAEEPGILRLVSDINEFWVDEGIIDQPVDPVKIVDGSYSTEALNAA
jgi:NitT/TauT family transport system substrate-binding protein